MDDFKTHVHSDGLSTEIAAFAKASRKSNSIKLKILVKLKEAAEMGLTPDEFVFRYGGLINTIRRRFTDLWKEGKIKHHPNLLARKNGAGNDCVTWVLGRDTGLTSWKPKRKWVGLTEEEINKYFLDNWARYYSYHGCFREVMRWQEERLKEKNT